MSLQELTGKKVIVVKLKEKNVNSVFPKDIIKCE